jgi:hypothetical protein
VNYAIEARKLSFETDADGFYSAQVNCVAGIYTEAKRFIRNETTTVESALRPETYNRVMQEGFPCQQSLDLPAGTYLLRLGVRDSRTGLIGTANAKVTVP